MRTRVFISRDSGALCVGAEEVARALFKAAEKRGLDVEIVRTGSRGMYWLEPTIEVARPEGRIGYGPVKPADIDSLLDAGMLDGGKHPLSLGLVEDIPFLKKQTRLTFARVGIVDPHSLEDYKAHGGYKGLEKAIAVGPEAIVEEVVNSGLRGRGGAGFPTGIKWPRLMAISMASTAWGYSEPPSSALPHRCPDPTPREIHRVRADHHERRRPSPPPTG